MTKFDTWFDEQDYCSLDGCYQEKYLAAQDAWDEQEERIQEVINRLENYPTCVFSTSPQEGKATNDLKVKFIEILKEELL